MLDVATGSNWSTSAVHKWVRNARTQYIKLLYGNECGRKAHTVEISQYERKVGDSVPRQTGLCPVGSSPARRGRSRISIAIERRRRHAALTPLSPECAPLGRNRDESREPPLSSCLSSDASHYTATIFKRIKYWGFFQRRRNKIERSLF